MSGRNYKLLTGVDADIDTSLLEYGLAWIDDPKSDEIEFFYGIAVDSKGLYEAFDNASLRRDLNPEQEWNWVKWEEVAKVYGTTEKELLALPLTGIVDVLLAYYGYENVFGSTYWNYLLWNQNIKRFQAA